MIYMILPFLKEYDDLMLVKTLLKEMSSWISLIDS